MDSFDYDELPELPPQRSGGCLWNFLTILVLLGVACVAAGFVLIYINPYSAINPFPPPGIPTVVSLPTSTPTPRQLEPTWTPLPTRKPAATETPRPTATLPPTATYFSLASLTPPSPTDTSTPPPGGFPYVLQGNAPLAIANIYHQDLGCAWLGVGGQVVDTANTPVTGLVIRLGGSLGGVPITDLRTSLTGLAMNYGRAGYEFKLADQPVNSNKTLWVQVLDQAGQPLSDRIFFDTYEDCNRNQIIVNIKQVR